MDRDLRGGGSRTPDPEAGGHFYHQQQGQQGQQQAGGRPRALSADPQAKYQKRWNIKAFMFVRRRLVLVVLAVLALTAGGSMLSRPRPAAPAEEEGGSSQLAGGHHHHHHHRMMMMEEEAAEQQRRPESGKKDSPVAAAIAAKRPRGGKADTAARAAAAEEEEEEDEELVELERTLAKEEAELKALEAQGDDDDDDDDGDLAAEAAEAEADRPNATPAMQQEMMEKMRKRKQHLTNYAKAAQAAADAVREQAGGAAALHHQEAAKAGAAEHQEPPPRDPSRHFHATAALEAAAARIAGRSPEEQQALTDERRKAVHAAILHAWGGYKEFAWGTDELQPIAKKGQDWFGLGLTLVDSLDLLWLIGETKEFEGARDWVAAHLNPSLDVHVNVFEVTIRVLGGLLAAYHFSGEAVFLEKAKELGQNLRPAMESPSGVPWSDAVLASRKAFAPNTAPDSSVSEATSIQLEFKYLAHVLGDESLYRLAERSMRAVDKARSSLPPGEMSALVPMFINAATGRFTPGATITLGARGDSYYEYLLKQWLLTGKADRFYLDLYNEAVAAIRSRLLRHSEPSGLAFIAELLGGQRFSPKMDHLVCYLPGTLALGVHHGCDESHLAMAKELMVTCFEMYNSTATGLSPEIAYFNTERSEDKLHDIIIQPRDTHNILRPETVESLFYLWRVTRDPVYREWGWQIFQAFEAHSKIATGGYSGLRNVQDPSEAAERIDKQESFFLGETLKYFYLLFADDSLLSLDDYVLNTEAHPFPVFKPKAEWLAPEPAEGQPEAAPGGGGAAVLERRDEEPMAPLAVAPQPPHEAQAHKQEQTHGHEELSEEESEEDHEHDHEHEEEEEEEEEEEDWDLGADGLEHALDEEAREDVAEA